MKKQGKESGGIKNKNLPLILLMYLMVFIIGFAYIIGHTLLIDIHADEYIDKALSQWTTDRVIAPKRGRIVDRNGIVLARSSASRTVVAEPRKIESEIERERVSNTLADILDMSAHSIYEKITNSTQEQITIKRQITEEQYAGIAGEYLRGVSFLMEPRRYYAQDSMAAQLIGLTNMNGEGQSGIEQEFEKELAGVPGRKITESDRLGAEVSFSSAQYIPAQDGANIFLSIDMVLQAALEEQMIELCEVSGAKEIQSVLVDADTGQVLAQVNLPSVNLNQPPREDAQELMNRLRNRVIRDVYAPHQLMDAITIAIALEHETIREHDTVLCEGSVEINGTVTKCNEAHGEQNLEAVLKNSCNVAIAQIAEKIDLQGYYESLAGFHIGQSTGIGLQRENNGTLIHKKYIAEGAKGAIGNGESIRMTSLQIACAYAALVNHGQYMQANVIDRIQAPDETIMAAWDAQKLAQPISPRTSDAMIELIRSVSETSTKHAYDLPGAGILSLSNTSRETTKQGDIMRTTNVAMAPADKPRFVLVTSIVDARIGHESFGQFIVGPYARAILHDVSMQMSTSAEVTEGEGAAEVVVPGLQGMLLNEAENFLTTDGLKALANGSGIVSEQSPAAGTIVPAGSSVILYMTGIAEDSSEQGEKESFVRVPDVMGMTLTEALNEMEEVSLVLDVEGNPVTTVISQYPLAGKRVSKGTHVSIRMERLKFVPGGTEEEAVAEEEVEADQTEDVEDTFTASPGEMDEMNEAESESEMPEG